jgi:hypothetical protein
MRGQLLQFTTSEDTNRCPRKTLRTKLRAIHSDIRLTLDTYGGFFGDDLDGLGKSIAKAFRKAHSKNVPKLFPLKTTQAGGTWNMTQNSLTKNWSRFGELIPAH